MSKKVIGIGKTINGTTLYYRRESTYKVPTGSGGGSTSYRLYHDATPDIQKAAIARADSISYLKENGVYMMPEEVEMADA